MSETETWQTKWALKVSQAEGRLDKRFGEKSATALLSREQAVDRSAAD